MNYPFLHESKVYLFAIQPRFRDLNLDFLSHSLLVVKLSPTQYDKDNFTYTYVLLLYLHENTANSVKVVLPKA